MMQWSMHADNLLESFHAGVYEMLVALLNNCEKDERGRPAAAALGKWLSEDGEWRAELKHAFGWREEKGGDMTAWMAIKKFCDAEKSDGKPWMWILDYADGLDVPAEAKAFFDAGTADDAPKGSPAYSGAG